MKRLYIVSWCSAALAVLVFWQTHVPTTMRPGAGPLVKKSWLISESASLTPKDLCRAPDQTFLTYPEWFLVFGPAEYADYLQHHTATSFPLMTHVFQAWESYAAVDDQIRGTFPPNDEYQTMIQVINTSSSIEFGIKAVYEAIIGRLTDSRDGSIETPEDQFAGNYARDYVSFLDTAPWYEFDFIAPLKRLWADTPLVGQHPIRKLERRYFLTTELTVKAAYGWALGLAGKAAYGTAAPATAVVLDRPPRPCPEISMFSTQNDGTTLATLPRYTPFTPLAIRLAEQGNAFHEIAGNRTAILVTIIAGPDWQCGSSAIKVLFSQPIPTKEGRTRWALATPVTELHHLLNDFSSKGIHIEHIFDF